ncbi:hypothetical protein LSTR_LSTR017527, partial [Laodelphax striatellus]
AYKAEPNHYDPIAKYSFQYAVKDDHTGDVKSQKETRHGDVVKGYYSLVQPDGKKRIVEYSADKKSGFVANVRYEGGYEHVYAPNHKAAPASKYQPLAVKYLGNKVEESQQNEFDQEVSKYESPNFDAFKYGSVKLELPETPKFESFNSAKLELPLKYDSPKFELPESHKYGEIPEFKGLKLDLSSFEAPKIDFSQYLLKAMAAKVEAPKTAEPLKANPSYSDIFNTPL